jgi:hypothetical protein
MSIVAFFMFCDERGLWSMEHHSNGAVGVMFLVVAGVQVPVELLRSSLPHTNDNQRAFLLDTIRKTVAAGGFAHGGRDMQPNTATVQC